MRVVVVTKDNEGRQMANFVTLTKGIWTLPNVRTPYNVWIDSKLCNLEIHETITIN